MRMIHLTIYADWHEAKTDFFDFANRPFCSDYRFAGIMA